MHIGNIQFKKEHNSEFQVVNLENICIYEVWVCESLCYFGGTKTWQTKESISCINNYIFPPAKNSTASDPTMGAEESDLSGPLAL